MSVRLNGTEYLEEVLAAPMTIGINAVSMGLWVQLKSSPANNHDLLTLCDVARNPNSFFQLATDNDGVSFGLWAGGAPPSPYVGTVGVWYWVTGCRGNSGGSNARLRIFTEDGTKVHDATVGNTDFDYTTVDTITIGQSWTAEQCDAELVNAKIQTGVYWSDEECVVEMRHFGIQVAGGTDRYAFKLDDITDTFDGLRSIPEVGMEALALTNSGGVNGASRRPSALEPLGMRVRQQAQFLMVSGPVSSVDVVFPANVLAGSVIDTLLEWESNPEDTTGYSAADSLNGSHTEIPASRLWASSLQQTQAVFYFVNSAAGACTVTGTFPAGRTAAGASSLEIAGADTTAPLDASNGSTNGDAATTTPTGGAVVPTTPGQLVVGSMQDYSNGSWPTITYPTGATVYPWAAGVSGIEVATFTYLRRTAHTYTPAVTLSATRKVLFSLRTYKPAILYGVGDNFDRANENPLSDGGAWDGDSSFDDLKVVSNAADGLTAATDAIMTRNDTGAGNDQWGAAVLTGVDMGLVLRGNGAGSAYEVGGSAHAGDGAFYYLTPTFVEITPAPPGPTWASGDEMYVEAFGASPTIIAVWRNGVLYAVRSDSTGPQSGGQPGLNVYDTAAGNAVAAWAGGGLWDASVAESVRLNATTDSLQATAAAPFSIGTDPYNIAAIITRKNNRNVWSQLFFAAPDFAGTAPGFGVSFSTDGTSFVAEYGSGSASSAGLDTALDVPYFVVASRSGTGAGLGSLRAFGMDGVKIGSTVTFTDATNYTTVDSIGVGAHGTGDPSGDVEITNLKLNAGAGATEWSDSQCAHEMRRYHLMQSGGATRYAFRLADLTDTFAGLRNIPEAGMEVLALTNSGCSNGTTHPSGLEVLGNIPYVRQVKHTPENDAGGGTVVAAFPADVLAGSLIDATIGWGGASEAPGTCADTQGDTFVEITACNKHSTTDNQNQSVFYAYNVAAGACTVTVTLPGSRGFTMLYVVELVGCATTTPLGDSDGANTDTADTVPTVPSLTPTSAGHLVLASYKDHSASSWPGFDYEGRGLPCVTGDTGIDMAMQFQVPISHAKPWSLSLVATRRVLSAGRTYAPATAPVLITRDEVVRYHMDEAASGTAPTALADASGNAYDLDTINYGAGNMAWVEPATGHRGLESTSLNGTQRALHAINDTSDAVRDALDGIPKVTLTVVATVVNGNPNGNRIFGINDRVGSNGRLMLKGINTGLPGRLDYNDDSLTFTALNLTATRAVLQFVVDSTFPDLADRGVYYINGEVAAMTVGTLSQDVNLSLPSGQDLIMFNRESSGAWDRAIQGSVFFAQIHADALSWEEAMVNAAVLYWRSDTALAGGAATLDQEGFRFYNDDGSESAATAYAAQDTNIVAPAGTTLRLRDLIDATGDPATKQYKLQFRKVGGSWEDVL